MNIASEPACCVTCAQIFSGKDVLDVATPLQVAQLRARDAISRAGTAVSLSLVAWESVGQSVCPELTYTTGPSDRIDEHLASKPSTERQGLLRAALGLPSNRFPRLVPTALAEPSRLILHEGMALKMAKKFDAAHYLLAKLTSRTALRPFEIWQDRDASGRICVRFLARYRMPASNASELVSHLVVMDAHGLGITQYVRRDRQVEDADRRGTLLFAAWAAPLA